MIKNTKAEISNLVNFAVVLPVDMLVTFLVANGYAAAWDLGNVKALANKIGAKVAYAQLEAIRAKAAADLTEKRRRLLAVARAAWVAGDARAFDAINF